MLMAVTLGIHDTNLNKMRVYLSDDQQYIIKKFFILVPGHEIWI